MDKDDPYALENEIFEDIQKPFRKGLDMDNEYLVQLLEQVRDQEGDWRQSLDDAIEILRNS